jgi:membrane protease YdiL (CAAX protease family)
MAGLIAQLLLSWLIIWLYERNNLKVLGLYPTRSRLRDFMVFLLVAAACCSSGFLLKMHYGNVSYKVNEALTAGLIWEGLWWNIKSVLFEELIFRGVIFYILLQKLGSLKAMLISSIAFGVYHWFSFGVLGNVPQMIFIFLLTGLMGMVYAYGYVRTMSLYIPCAIHLGWNFTQGFVFSEGSIGTGILKPVNNTPFLTNSYLVFFIVFLVPLVSVMLINFLLIKRKAQVDTGIYQKKRVAAPAL